MTFQTIVGKYIESLSISLYPSFIIPFKPFSQNKLINNKNEAINNVKYNIVI